MPVVFRPILFIDTCALADKPFLKWLARYNGIKKISVFTYMEYLTHMLDMGQTSSDLDRVLKQAKIDVEYFTKADAAEGALLMSYHPAGSRRCGTCRQVNWNDTAIAAQSNRYQAWIVTKNLSDFPTDDSSNVKSPDVIMNELSGYC